MLSIDLLRRQVDLRAFLVWNCQNQNTDTVFVIQRIAHDFSSIGADCKGRGSCGRDSKVSKN